MTLDEKTQNFLSDLIDRAQDPRVAIIYCQEKRQTAPPFLKVLATSLLWTYLDIKDYLDEYETSADRYALPLEKIEAERMRIRQQVLLPFVDNLNQQRKFNSQDEVLLLIGNFILSWDNCPKHVLPEQVI